MSLGDRVKQTDINTFELLRDDETSFSTLAPGEIVLGTVTGFDSNGQCLVDYHANPNKASLVAMTTQAVSQKHIGRQAALLFTNGDPRQPVIVGLIHSPLQDMLETYEMTSAHNEQAEGGHQSRPVADDVTIDGKRIVLEGQEEIVLKCGDASITLTRAGKILIRGRYLLNRSSGVNRIMGGSVQVN